MDFSHTEDRRMLADTLSRFLRENHDIAGRSDLAHSVPGFDADLWAQLAGLGMIGALIAEDHGGYGGSGFDIMVVFEELGRALVPVPMLSSAVLGARLAGAAGRPDLAEAVIAGTRHLALAHSEPDSRYDMERVGTRADPDGEAWRLNGAKAMVYGGPVADPIIVSARISGDIDDDDGLALFLVAREAAGLSVRDYPLVDGASASDLVLENVAVGADDVLGEPGQALPLIEQAIAAGVLALSAEAVGAMEAARDMTLDYLRQRKQFGRPIASFQALQHRAVEMVMEIEQARSAVIRAASLLQGERRERERAVSAAKNLAGRAGRLVAEESIQMHGGIGMTWEYAVGHYAKRIVMIDHQLGDVDYHLERYGLLGRDA